MNEPMAHILLVEDEEAHADLVRHAFVAYQGQFHLTVTGNLEEARACLAEAPIDLIITDLSLPDGLGTSLLPAGGEGLTVPLVVMTAQGDQAAAVAAMKAGALDYLVKSEEVLADTPHIAERVVREWRHIVERRTVEEELTVLYDISRILSESEDFESKSARVMERLAQLTEAEWVTLRLERDDEPGLRLVAAAGTAVSTSPPMPVLTSKETLAYGALSDGRLVVANDYQMEPKASPNIVALGMKSMVLIPIKSGDHTAGLVNVVSRRTNHFSPDLVKLLTAVGEGLGALLEKARLDEARQKADEQIRASLAEKELLLREINHRVKNNLQIVSSLLYLQSREVQDPQARMVFEASQDRIKAMALVHEKLYQSPDLARIDFGEYIRSLTTELYSSFGLRASGIGLVVDVDGVNPGIDAAIPCGLIVNELVSNSLKHAFPGRAQGEISIKLRTLGGQHTMVVTDDGIGYPADLELAQVDSLGLTIVKALAAELGGEVTLRSRGCAQTEINFPAN